MKIQIKNGRVVDPKNNIDSKLDVYIAAGKIDAVAFGTSFLANPDLPARIKAGAPLNRPKPASFYTSGPEGYTDYPTLNPS